MSAPTLHIIDGHSQVFRAYHAIRGGLSTATGVPTNAVYGFLMGLNALIKAERPTHLLVVFDGGHDERSALHPAYKSNRAETPADLLEQLPLIERALKALGINTLRVKGQEADDLIATIARQARQQGFDVAIVSNDKDLFQLVDDHTVVLRTLPREAMQRCDAAAVRELLGVDPPQVTDYQGLTGDPVDCIPGVPGIGPKTAAKLLAEHGDLESVLAAADAMPQSKIRENLKAHAESARLSKRLATLCDALPVTFDPAQAAWTFRPNPALTALLKELEFNTLLQVWGEAAPAAETQTEVITTEQALAAFVAAARAAPLLAVDTETSGVDEMRCALVGISLAHRPGHAVYIPIGHTALDGAAHGQLDLDTVRRVLGPLLDDPAVPKVGHHLKYDLKVLRRHGLPVRGIAFDTMLASQCLSPDKRGHGLKDLTLERLGVRQRRLEELIGTGKNQISFAEVPIADAAAYAGPDADLCLRLAEILRAELEKSGLLDLFVEIEVPLIEVLADMEMAGVALDLPTFETLRAEISERLEALTREIHALAGHEFKINSPAQLRQVLFEELGLPTGKRGKTGHSTDVDVLETLAALHPLPAKVLEHRGLEKLLSTYIEALPRLVNPQTGRLHTTFHQIGAATGRLSSSDPNLQNIPVRTELGRRIRAGFRPACPGHVFLAADYSQIELRIAAHLSGDPALAEVFARGEDIHRANAARVHGIAPEDVSPAQREAAKRVTFGILYGISAHRLAQDLGLSRSEAQRLIDQCFETFRGLRAWMDRTLAEARERGYVATISGRRRFIADIHSKNFSLRSAAERAAINTPVQGSAADLIKIAMRHIAAHLAAQGLRARMVLQVHDELIFDLPEEEVAPLRPAIIDLMAHALPLSVPVVVDVAVGATWADC